MPLLFLDLSTGELLLIVMAVMILFGPKRIPEIARTVGQTVGKLRAASDQIKKEILSEARTMEGVNKITNPVSTIVDEVNNNLSTTVLSNNSSNQEAIHSKTDTDREKGSSETVSS
ncbi:MAG TPA: twin-arginine translocase TatA/TatE family subunit [Bacteroidales bacterium]|nr:twin-arginine translocase TatA/TatE family subunit [Bacteroidales bacterium]